MILLRNIHTDKQQNKSAEVARLREENGELRRPPQAATPIPYYYITLHYTMLYIYHTTFTVYDITLCYIIPY